MNASGGGKQRSMREEQLCSLHFLKTGMPWMDLAPPQPEAEDGAGPGAEPASGPVQEGRLACPCCGAKIGKFDLTGNVSCSCGVEVRPLGRVCARDSLPGAEAPCVLESTMSNICRACRTSGPAPFSCL